MTTKIPQNFIEHCRKQFETLLTANDKIELELRINSNSVFNLHFENKLNNAWNIKIEYKEDTEFEFKCIDKLQLQKFIKIIPNLSKYFVECNYCHDMCLNKESMSVLKEYSTEDLSSHVLYINDNYVCKLCYLDVLFDEDENEDENDLSFDMICVNFINLLKSGNQIILIRDLFQYYNIKINFHFLSDKLCQISLEILKCKNEERAYNNNDNNIYYFSCNEKNLKKFIMELQNLKNYFTHCTLCGYNMCIKPNANKIKEFMDNLNLLRFHSLCLDNDKSICHECFGKIIQNDEKSVWNCDICTELKFGEMKYINEDEIDNCSKHLKICIECLKNCHWDCPVCQKRLY